MSELNLAGRAGKWSAENWKKALFGWLGFAVVAMAVGSVVGHVQMRDSQSALGRGARPRCGMLEQAGFKQPASENVLIQSRTLTPADDPPSSPRSRAVVQALDGQKNVTNIQNPLVDAGRRRPDLERRPLGARPVHDQGRPRQGEGQGQADPRRDRGRAGGEPELSVARGRRRERELRARQALHQGLRERRAADDPDHAGHPARRVRRARRGGLPGAARLLGRARLARALRARHARATAATTSRPRP